MSDSKGNTIYISDFEIESNSITYHIIQRGYTEHIQLIAGMIHTSIGVPPNLTKIMAEYMLDIGDYLDTDIQCTVAEMRKIDQYSYHPTFQCRPIHHDSYAGLFYELYFLLDITMKHPHNEDGGVIAYNKKTENWEEFMTWIQGVKISFDDILARVCHESIEHISRIRSWQFILIQHHSSLPNKTIIPKF